jgi:predicted ATPase
MIDKIYFENYKAFKDSQELEIKPFTILIGKNSAGKSAVGKLLPLISDSLKGENKQPLRVKIGDVELGGEYRDLVYGRKYAFLELGLERADKSLSIKIAPALRPTDDISIADWKYEDAEISLKKDGNSKGFIPEESIKKSDGNSVDISTIFGFKVDYIGPFRVQPKRSYNKPQVADGSVVGIDGRYAYDLLINDSLNTSSELLKNVSDWYKSNFEEWGVKIVENGNSQFSIELNNKNALSVNLRDVGEGMGQILPLVVRAYMPIEDDTIIVIEQPELHLHPAAHGNLAQLFADSLSKNNNTRYIIETHSQNFVLRLRRLIAEGKLDSDSVVIYYVDFDEESQKSSLNKITVNSLGEVSDWPEGVFSESLDEAIAIRTAQIDKEN